MQQRLLQYTPRNSRHLKPDALPIVNLPRVPKISQTVNNEERSLRLGKRRRRKEVKDIINTSTSTQSQISNNRTIPEEHVMNLAKNIDIELDNIEHKLPDSREYVPRILNLIFHINNNFAINFRIDQSKINELQEKVKILEQQNNDF